MLQDVKLTSVHTSATCFDFI